MFSKVLCYKEHNSSPDVDIKKKYQAKNVFTFTVKLIKSCVFFYFNIASSVVK